MDWRRAGRREIGDYISDHMQGKLAEKAFAKMLEKKYGVLCELDFEVRPGIQVTDESDIKRVIVGDEYMSPGLKVDVKATTPRAKYLLIDAREFENRKYDAYVLVTVDLPKDHLIRYLLPICAHHLDLPEDVLQHIGSLASIEAEILGFAYREDIEERGMLFRAGEWLPDPNNPRRKLVQLKVDNYGLPITLLRKSEEEWQDFVSRLCSTIS